MQKLKVGDKVKVLSGKDRGREGNIEVIFPKKGAAIIPGINVYKKHVKKQMARDGKGGIFDIPKPISLSKLAIIDPKTGKTARVGFKIQGGKKLRISKKSKALLDIGKKGKKK